jgi:hypothetical protein
MVTMSYQREGRVGAQSICARIYLNAFVFVLLINLVNGALIFQIMFLARVGHARCVVLQCLDCLTEVSLTYMC